MKSCKPSFFGQAFGMLILLSCGACVKELNFKLGKLENTLVVFGTLSDQPGKHIFRVTRTNAFEKQVDSDPVSGATLFVRDARGQTYPFVEMDPGTYQLQDTTFHGLAGETYYLELTLPDGEKYRSEPEIMPHPIKLDRAYPEVEVKDNNQTLQVLADISIAADPNGVYLRWNVKRVWRRTSIDLATLFQNYTKFKPPAVCYMTEDPEPNAIRVFGAKRRDAFSLREQEVARIPVDYRFFERNAIEVIQYRISEKTQDYWYKLNLVGNPDGSIFDVPPASVRGNIYKVGQNKEPILGYFEVAAVDTAYTYTDLSNFPLYINDPCRRDFTKPEWESTYYFHPECAFCENIKDHSLIVPKFW